ncbi:MAG: S8 family serine peptidase [Anaerolineaceae bacterium]|nr:S8 family serine peptidase [Anaerolineaceae bacterium]
MKKKSSNTDWKNRIDKLFSKQRIIIILVFSVLMIFGAGAGVFYMISSQENIDSGSLNFEEIELPPSLSELGELYPEYSDILNDPELGSIYKHFFMIYQEEGSEAALEMARKRGLINERNEFKIILELESEPSDDLRGAIESMGIVIAAEGGLLMDIIIPPSLIESVMNSDEPEKLFSEITDLEIVKRVKFPDFISSENIQMDGDSVDLVAADAWHTAGITGKGVKVGVLDMDFADYEKLLGSELPSNVTVKSFIYGVDFSDMTNPHGTACAEIVHSLAPDAELFLAAYNTQAEFYVAVDWLVNEMGVDIITNSTNWILGPMDGTDDMAKKVNQVADQGVLWVNSTGNNAQSHYYAAFSADEDGYHQFAPGVNVMAVKPYSSRLRIVLNWKDNPDGLASDDYAFILMNAGGEVLAQSDDLQNQNDISYPAEFIQFEVKSEQTYYVAVKANKVTKPTELNIHAFDSWFEYSVSSYSVMIPANASGSFSVGATYLAEDFIEGYSGQGPALDGRLKPEISAPAGVNTVSYNNAFIGTSCACPHVAGASAMLWQVYGNSTDIKNTLMNRAIDLGDAGPDNTFGAGRLFLGEPVISEAENILENPVSELPIVVSEEIDPVEIPTPQVQQADLVSMNYEADKMRIILAIGVTCCLGVFGLLGLIVIIVIVMRKRK